MRTYTSEEARAYIHASSQFYAGLAARGWYGDHVCMAPHPVTVHGSPDHLVEDGATDGAVITGGWADQVVGALDGLSTEASIRRALDTQAERIEIDAFAELLHEKMLLGLMLGGLDSAKEHENILGLSLGSVQFRQQEPFSRHPLQSALELWEQRKVLPPRQFALLSAELKQRAFTFAGTARTELISVAHAELTKQIRDGNINLRDFKVFAKARLESAGWTPKNRSHVETIFRTNVGSALSSGRYAEQTRPEVLAALPYWQIRGVPDARARKSHKDAHNIVLPATHEFWQIAYPPFGFNCRCSCIARTAAWLRRTGTSLGPVPRNLPDPGFTSGVRGLVTVPDNLKAPTQEQAPTVPQQAPQPSPPRGTEPAPLPAPAAPPPRPFDSGSPSAPSPRIEVPKSPPGWAPTWQTELPPPPKPAEVPSVQIRVQDRKSGWRWKRKSLSPEQRKAEQISSWVRSSPEARAAASEPERVQALLWEWTRGSNRKTSVLVKKAAKEEFRLSGDLWSAKKVFSFDSTTLAHAREDVRAMYNSAQEYFRSHNISTVQVYRGVKPGTPKEVRNAVESWTTDVKTAKKFATSKGRVLVEEVPVEKILAYHRAPPWVDGPYGSQFEALVMW